MPVSPATVRQAFVHHEPVMREGRAASPPGDHRGRASERTPLTRRLVLAGACVFAFLVGFAAVTLLMRDAGSASKPRSETTPTSAAPGPAAPRAPARSAPAATFTPAPPPNMIVGDQVGSASVTTSPPAPAPMPRADNGGAPAPSTSAPPTTTSPSTTTPTTTAP